jgi:hypothetical protein
VRNVVFIVRRGRAFLAFDVLIEFARRDVDALHHIASAQPLPLYLAPQALPVIGVDQAFAGQLVGQLRQRHLVALGDVLQRGVDLFVRHHDAGMVGALFLDGLEHQPLQHLFAHHAGGWQRDILCLQALGHFADLGVELALEHHAVVDDGDDAVEEITTTGMRARAGCRGGGGGRWRGVCGGAGVRHQRHAGAQGEEGRQQTGQGTEIHDLL